MLGYRQQNFYLVSPDQELRRILEGLWPDSEVHWLVFERGTGSIERIFNEPPDLLVVDMGMEDIDGLELVKLVKGENVYRQVPVILCFQDDLPQSISDFSGIEVDDFLLRPVSERVAKARLGLTFSRATRSLDANPLTRLPGNTSIIHRIQDMIDQEEEFALAYVDLDHFKSFNDKYGFSRGDEVLMMTSRVITNTIRGFVGADAFVGHVGGDDYVFLLPVDKAEEASQRIVESFDDIIPHFYDPEDRKRGGISSTDRQGNIQEFPIMTISIGVVFNNNARLTHYGQASQLAMNLKKKAKENPQSSYVLDRRKSS
jgi:diguanylate cyclase (GGDEF)-like protein